MIAEQKIPCPVCKTPIPFDPYQLIKGVQFACPNCGAVVGVAQQSVDTVKNAMEEFDEMKKNVLKARNENK